MSQHTMKRGLRRYGARLGAAALVVLVTSSAQAASVQWGTPKGITAGPNGPSDVSTNGTLVRAFNLAGSSTTVNGVNFENFPVGNITNTVGNFTVSHPDKTILSAARGSAQTPYMNVVAAYRALLEDTAIVEHQRELFLTMNGLTVGQAYQVQLWVNDSRSFDPPGFTFPVSATAGNSVQLDPNTNIVEGGLGQHVVGTFIADATSQEIVITADEVGGSLNAFQLRAVVLPTEHPAPTASTTTLLGMCALLLLFGARAVRGPIGTASVHQGSAIGQSRRC